MKFVETIKDALGWTGPEPRGTAKITTLLNPRHDMVFFRVGAPSDPTGEEFVFTERGVFAPGQTVEVWTQKDRTSGGRYGLPRSQPTRCRAAIRPASPQPPSTQELEQLKSMLTNPQNEKDIFTARAFFRRFLGAGKYVRPLDISDITEE